MAASIGIRRETKDATEHRVALVPQQVRQLVAEQGIRVVVEPSPTRIFSDEDYRAAGAELNADLSSCNLIIGIKEVPVKDLIPGKSYLFFSHTIKRQPHNMLMLQAILDKKITLLDYELITNEQGRRLVFFGNFAGYAGMINTLWAYGQRLRQEGVDSPFTELRQARAYDSLAAAEVAVAALGERIRREGLPAVIPPLVCGFAGYGQVSKGAQKIFDLLPSEEIAPADLAAFRRAGKTDRHRVYKVEFHESDMFEPREAGEAFDLQRYFTRPELFRDRFYHFLPQLSLLVNGIYWAPQYPRLVSREQLAAAWRAEGGLALKVIGDITCDIEGSIEMTLKATTSTNPVYVYHPVSGELRDGFAGEGVVVMTIDKLPAELPREASEAFGKSLLPFIPALAGADFTTTREEVSIDPAMQNAIIAWQGGLVPKYRHLL